MPVSCFFSPIVLMLITCSISLKSAIIPGDNAKHGLQAISEFDAIHQRVKAARAVFYLGDSTSEKIYLYGLTSLLNCTTFDPNSLLDVEANNKTGLMCYPPNSARGFMRIGYMRHWGVSREDKDYYRSWERMNKLEDTDTENSIVNIINAVEEFKQRSADDTDVTFIFLSNLWDNHRYKYNYPNVPFEAWLIQYQHNYTALVAEILIRLRPGKDTLVLQTQHPISSNHTAVSTIVPMNSIVRKIADYFNLPVFDEYHLVEGYSKGFKTPYLQDAIHQTNGYSVLLAQHIISKTWATVNYCDGLREPMEPG